MDTPINTIAIDVRYPVTSIKMGRASVAWEVLAQRHAWCRVAGDLFWKGPAVALVLALPIPCKASLSMRREMQQGRQSRSRSMPTAECLRRARDLRAHLLVVMVDHIPKRRL